ncbi:helicase associated domain-containing protein [Streptomyces sp. NPDC058287]|uniref:helicase associated domain-containing protein n=1 Tax=Streptomyces sp. NPDC058287 TaxID=3346423 RepID=UPI0036E7B2D1
MHAEGAFAAGLTHARTYAAQHGHLATQRDTRVGSFSLGKRVHNQQAHALALPEEKAAALKERAKAFHLSGWRRCRRTPRYGTSPP